MDIRRRWKREDWRTVGDDPDERFTLANERTFLAWNRTALALVTAGLAITQLLPKFSFSGARRLIGLPLILLGTVIGYMSYWQWVANEKALRMKKPLPPSRLPSLLSAVITVTAVIALVLAATAHGK
jgi:putative membrane protein